jgi:hypothetical protein
VFPKLHFPAYFEGGLVGVSALETIEHGDMIISVPFGMLISDLTAKSDPLIGKIVLKNPKFFNPTDIKDNQKILILFLLYEMQKGESSKWAPYFDMLPKVTLFHDWDLVVRNEF